MASRRTLLALLAAVALLATAPASRTFADDPAPGAPPEIPLPKRDADEPAGPDAKTRADVIKILDDLREEASRIRGLAWKSKVEADVLTRAQLMKRLEEMIKDELDPKEYERDLKTARRLGLLTAEQDPIEMTKKFLSLGIAGYFDPKTKKLYLIDGLTGDAQRPTILHELTHALEDQYIDLEKTQEAIKKDQDKMFALKCVIEGSAETARSIYDKEHPDYARLSQQEQMKSANQAELMKVLKETPAMLFLGTLLHYQIGPAFVGRWIRTTGKGGTTQAEYPTAIAKLYAEMPTTEEQVLHPSKFVGEHRDLPRTIAWPTDLAAAAGEDWVGLEQQPIGELDMQLWIDRWLGGNGGKLDAALMATGRYFAEGSRIAGEGWDGAWMQVLEMKGDPRAYVLSSAWDSPKDAVEAGNAFLEAAKKQYGDKFKSGEWVDKDGVRTSNYEGSYGLARIEVRGEEMRIVDGLPLESLDRVFAELSKATFQKDPKDTWTPENAPDATSGADWRHEKSGLAWKKPGEGWTVTGTGDEAMIKKDSLEIRVRVHASGLLLVAGAAVKDMTRRYPDLDVQKAVSEATVAGKESARIEFDSRTRADPDGAKRHIVTVIVPAGATQTLVLQSSLEMEGWGAVAKDFDAALATFMVKD
jgi:hypothetical protein